MSDFKQDKEAKEFVKRWADRSSEKEFSQKFWIDLLSNVYGVEQVTEYLEFEKPVIIDGNTKFIDVYIPSTKVIIEQKSGDKDLTKAQKQSDGALLSPMGQMKRYADNMKFSERPRWGISCNFHDIMIFDFEYPNSEPELIKLADLPKELHRLDFLIKKENVRTQREVEISIAAGAIVGKIYDALKKNYKEETEETLKSLNILCVRLIFCLYAEDSGIFSKDQFYYYMKTFPETKFRSALKELFTVLNTPLEEREYGLEEDLNAFPYVNGGLFAEEIELPKFDVETVTVILEEASIGFNWKHISPTIFGAVFESTLSTKLRRAGGMHYTSIENIHKVIDPLFLDELNDEFNTIISKKYNRISEKKEKLRVFQDKIASLTFLDPACGSGNFLTETFISLRKLENKILLALYTESASAMLDFGDEFTPVKVNIHQFYGIEINDFAVSVAKTALWIAEYQMLEETQSIVNRSLDFLPLKSYSNIVESNALRIDWKEVITPEKLNYIMGNPPFVGHQWRNKEQASDMDLIFGDMPKYGKLDYVTSWYKKSADFVQHTKTKIAFVSTNSICQGESVGILWKYLAEKLNVNIIFAYRSFIWNSESNSNAHVYCVIVGFQCFNSSDKKILFDDDTQICTNHINGYLLSAPDVFLNSRGKNINKNLPNIIQGNKPWDGGHLILSEEEASYFKKKYPITETYIKRFCGSSDFIHNNIRYCLWLKDVLPQNYIHIPEIKTRLKLVAETRLKTKTLAVQKQAETPMLFSQIRQPDTNYLAIPEVSGENRKYIPIGFLSSDVIASNKLFLIPNGNLFYFGILISNVHMSWMYNFAGRLGMSYSYSPSVYNNFPFPNNITDIQKHKIEKCADNILEIRNKYKHSSLADLYDKFAMPPDLIKAHQANDRAVMEAYGFIKNVNGKATWYTQSECIAALMKMYQELTSKENK